MKCDRGECAVKIEPKIFDELRTVLSSFGDKYFVGEELNRSKLSEDLRIYNEALLEKLFQTDFIKQHFIKEVAGQKLFQIEQLEEAILYNDYWDTSYTKYENRIGLASNGKFLEDSQDVVLDFPFKDGVLTASMTKEDSEDGYDDAFLNEVIEKDEIDRLFDKKIFVNSKRYDENGESAVTDFNEDKDNLIIKGNNLLALHAIKNKYMAKVKSIFIDPPYFFSTKKPADTYSYNSNFKLSGWLTFIKNRLEVSKELLSDDGLIFLTMSDEGVHYLKVLMDSVFGIENFIADVTWEARKSISSDALISMNSNHVLVYAKNLSIINKNDFRLALDIETFKNDDDDGRGKYRLEPFDSPNFRANLQYEIVTPTGRKITPSKNRSWRTEKQTYERLLSEGRIYFGKDGNAKPSLKAYYNEVKDAGKGKTPSTIWHDANSIIWTEADTNTNATKHQVNLFNDVVFSYPKPERLIQRILELSTDTGDIVLDFFMGSATTQAVAMKMNRRFIGIEQMDYINEVSVPRLQKVIAGEQGGISKEVNWQGGGSFVYTELMSKNMGYLQDIIHSKTLDELKVVHHRMLEGTDSMEPADISFRADLDKIDWMEGFVENKRLLIKLLDKNGLYYNYSEIDDANVRELISDKDYLFNKQFYKGGE